MLAFSTRTTSFSSAAPASSRFHVQRRLDDTEFGEKGLLRRQIGTAMRTSTRAAFTAALLGGCVLPGVSPDLTETNCTRHVPRSSHRLSRLHFRQIRPCRLARR